jgi:hypothetical protein
MSLLLPANGHEQDVASLILHLNKPITSSVALQVHICLTNVGSATPQALVAFSHAALFSSALFTLVMALTEGFLPQVPGLTLVTLTKYPPHSVATIKGHLDQICKNLRLTKTIKPHTFPDPEDVLEVLTKCFPSSEAGNPTTHNCYAVVISPQPTGQVHLDQTSMFHIASSTCNNYLLIFYYFDSNGILAMPVPKRTGLYILHADRTIHMLSLIVLRFISVFEPVD